MKKIKNFVFPVVIALIGTGAALATNSVKSDSVLEMGYYFDNSVPIDKCKESGVMCKPSGSVTCTWKDPNNVTHNLYRYNDRLSCGISLYKN